MSPFSTRLSATEYFVFFTFYSANISKVICAHDILHHCYADDNQLYASCARSDNDNLKSNIIACIGDIAEWMASNWVYVVRYNSLPSLYGTKCISLIKQWHHPFLVSQEPRSLFDKGMTMTNVNWLVSSSFHQLQRILTIRRSIPISVAVELINSFVVSRIDYYNGLLPSRPVGSHKSILNCSVWIVYRRGKFDHVTLFLRDKLIGLR